MQTHSVIIQGSSRTDGNTNFFAEELLQYATADIIHLKSYSIGHYDYDKNNTADDFLPLIKELIEQYDTWIFASPVYWYSMSGLTKVFIDRISDLLHDPHKDLGRKLRNKKMAVLSVSNEDDIPESFYSAFKLSADYLGMDFLGQMHAYGTDYNYGQVVKERLEIFSKLIAQ